MIQLKKRVTRLKIQHFLKENRLVLLFHYNVKQNSTKNRSPCDIKTQLLSLGQGSVFSMKNRIAQTLTKESNRNDTNFFITALRSPLEKKKNSKITQLPNQIGQQEVDSCLAGKRTNLELLQVKKKTALFQGPTTLLGIESVSQLHKILKLCKQEETLVLLGGFYENQAINCVQLERLSLLSKQEQIFLDLHLVRCIQRPILQVFFTLSIHPFCSTLGAVRWRLMQLLNWRLGQLSTLTEMKNKRTYQI